MKHGLRQNNLLRHFTPERFSLLRELGKLADDSGMCLYLVGGVVRDLLLKRDNWDIDLTIEGNGIGFARMVAARYGAALALFERFATARLIFQNGLKIDIATTRGESYMRPAVLPTVQPASIEEDLYRRDFTINAMALQLNPQQFGRMLDLYGGQRDIKAKTIRVLHQRSFIDDPTRIFRAIRFTQRFGFFIEPSTRHLLEEAAASRLIQQLSGPRLCNEILLLLSERDPGKPIKMLVRLKLLRFLHPRLRYTEKEKRVIAVLPRALTWWKNQCPELEVERSLVYLMGILSKAGEAVLFAVIQRLLLTSLQSRAVKWAGRKTDRTAQTLVQNNDLRPAKVYRLLNGMPDEAIVLLMAKGLAIMKGGGHRLTRRLSRFLAHDRLTTTILTGKDLAQLGLKPGPEFKTILNHLLDARLNGRIKTESEERAFVHRIVQKHIDRRGGASLA